MSISAGSKLGPYEIVAPIGRGGMGEVWKARDTRLGRDVAIKISAEQFSERFEREARAVAALNHPNICTLYDVGPNYLVMEYIEGTPLKGPLSVEKAVEYSGQILDALDAAHRKGITHRDLKPANILVTKQGIKLLDFGLAKQAIRLGEDEPTKALTDQDQIIGTLQYMSPEQLQGKEADPRSDLFSFGCVLYEMLSGKRAFEGKNSASVIAAILEREPPKLDTALPLGRIVRRSLAKDPDQRFQTARDLKAALNWALEQPPPIPANPVQRRWTWIAATAVLALGALLSAFLYFHGASRETRVLKLFVPPPEKAAFSPLGLPTVSPDGRRLAFVATLGGQRSLWVRDLDSLAARPLPETGGATYPFWSPDSRFLAFFADGKLKKINVSGGPVLTLCDAPNGAGGTWSKDDIIVFAPSTFLSGLFRVPAAGGNASPLTELDQGSFEISHRFPWFLPDGRHFLYLATIRNPQTAVFAGDIDSKTRQRVAAVSSNAVYSPPGYLLFLRDRTLMAQPFDASKAKTTGDAVPIAERVDYISGQGQFSVSQNGVLVYTSGAVATGGNEQLTWFDRSGKVLGTVGAPGVMRWPAISPDGNTVAVDRLDPQTRTVDIWFHDLARGTDSRFTFGPKSNTSPVWSPDGSKVAFSSNRAGGLNIYEKATSGTAQDEVLDKDARTGKVAMDWSRDGRYILEGFTAPKTKADVWVLPLFGDHKPFPYLQTEFNDFDAKLSPNGQWLAYSSDETNRFEVYVQTFPKPGGKWQVSTDGGSFPVWSRDGKELFFIGGHNINPTGSTQGPDQKMMVADVKPGAKFEASVPKPLFDTRLGGPYPWFDVSKDGRFLIPTMQSDQSANAPITVVVNWTAGLKK